MMVATSYVIVSLAMGGAAIYLYFKLRLFLTATTMLLGSLLLIYGPAYLSFMLSSGEKAMVIERLSGTIGGTSLIFASIRAASLDFPAVITAMNFAMALMFVGVLAGVESVNYAMPRRIVAMEFAVRNWNEQRLKAAVDGNHQTILLAIGCLTLFMGWVSFKENHILTIKTFLSITGDEDARIAYRFTNGGSPDYLYRIILGAVAPMLFVWGALLSWINRSWIMLLASALLLVAIVIGKLETLSKAPLAFFLIQLLLAGVLVLRNRVTWRTVLAALFAVIPVLYLTIKIAMSRLDNLGALGFLYYRVFEIPSESLLETFAAFPFRHAHTWGANIRPLATIMGIDYTPAFTIISLLWHDSKDTTSNALFVADAWVDFSYAGVIIFSIMAGATCRFIDAVFLVNGKTIVGIAIMAAAFVGVFTALISALNTAFLSGGLLLAPLLAGLLLNASKLLRKLRPALVRTGES